MSRKFTLRSARLACIADIFIKAREGNETASAKLGEKSMEKERKLRSENSGSEHSSYGFLRWREPSFPWLEIYFIN